jgi:hypothetical protein
VGQGTFAPGHVFTIEPGIYISTKLLDMLPDTPKNQQMIAKVRKAVERYQNTGVRIEDDYVITPGGVEWLSRAPREIGEIEKLKLVSRLSTSVRGHHHRRVVAGPDLGLHHAALDPGEHAG